MFAPLFLTLLLHYRQVKFIFYQNLQHEIRTRQIERDTFQEVADHHTSLCHNSGIKDDLSVLEREIASITKRWNDLSVNVSDQLEKKENIQDTLLRYEKLHCVVEEIVLQMEHMVSVEYVLVLDVRKAKQDVAEAKVTRTRI